MPYRKNLVESYGAVTKKRGVVIRSTTGLGEITKLIVDRKMEQPAHSIGEVYQERRPVFNRGRRQRVRDLKKL
ncbi:MAG TPA: hypothetical protein VF172_03075 [Nitrososphaera sp.]